MAKENYVEGCSMQRSPLIEPNGLCFWKARFETYVKTKDIDLWQVIQNGDFYFEVEDKETKLMKETSNELLKDNEKKKLGKNEEAKMTIYNALPYKECERFFMCKTTKERSKVTVIKEANHLATLPLDELIKNLKVYEMVLDNDGIASNTTMEKVKSIDLKLKSLGIKIVMIAIVKEKVMNTLMKKKPRHSIYWLKLLFGKGRGNSFEDKGGENSKKKEAYYNCGIEGHFASDCRKPKENKDFMGGAWCDSEDDDEHQNDATFLMAIDSKEEQPKGKGRRWRRLGHANVRLVKNLASNKLVRKLPKLSFERQFCDTYGLGSQEHDRIDEPIVQDLNGSPSLQVNVSDKGYPKSLKEAKDHPID
nr:hypothetical protein [Tanacetum cinerariifolium]